MGDGWLDLFGRRREATTYARKLAQWQLECEKLSEALARADSDSSPLTSRVGTRLHRGEFLQYELTDVQLVETRELPASSTSRQANVGINTPISIGFSTTRTTPTEPVDRSVVLDTGTVAITDRRITFAGRKHARQWRLDDLICPVRGDDGCTIYLPVSTRERTSGFRYPPELGWTVTTQLEVALARHSGDWRVVASWRRRQETLLGNRPRPPADVAVTHGTEARARTWAQRNSTSRSAEAPTGVPNLGRRMKARVIDLVLGSVLFTYLDLLFGRLEGGALLAFVGTVLLYETLPVWRRGGSFGKRAVGLAVIDLDTGASPPLWQSFLRSAVIAAPLVTIVAPLLQLLWLAMGLDRETWHDRVAGTDVVLR